MQMCRYGNVQIIEPGFYATGPIGLMLNNSNLMYSGKAKVKRQNQSSAKSILPARSARVSVMLLHAIGKISGITRLAFLLLKA
jgi:hypothetical protein